MRASTILSAKNCEWYIRKLTYLMLDGHLFLLSLGQLNLEAKHLPAEEANKSHPLLFTPVCFCSV